MRVVVWFDGRSALCIVSSATASHRYRDPILLLVVIPTMIHNNLLFQYDNTALGVDFITV